MPDTEGALDDMRMARSHIDDWLDETDKSGLRLATPFIYSALEKDPDARLVVEKKHGGKMESFVYTPKTIAAESLTIEAGIILDIYGGKQYKEQYQRKRLEEARDVLLKALSYNPTSLYVRDRLAHTYYYLRSGEDALRTAEEAVREAPPGDIEARKLRDRIADLNSQPVRDRPSSSVGCFRVGLIIIGIFVVLFIIEIASSSA